MILLYSQGTFPLYEIIKCSARKLQGFSTNAELTHEEIAPAGFKGMSIEKISLPYGLKEIRNRAFMDCSSLKTIYFGCADSLKSANEKKWNAIPKGDDWNKNVNAAFTVVFKGK